MRNASIFVSLPDVHSLSTSSLSVVLCTSPSASAMLATYGPIIRQPLNLNVSSVLFLSNISHNAGPGLSSDGLSVNRPSSSSDLTDVFVAIASPIHLNTGSGSMNDKLNPSTK